MAGSTKIIDGNPISDADPLQMVDAAVAPGSDIVAVTKDNATADPNGPFRGLIMDAIGAVKLHTAAGNDVTLPSGLLAPGVIHAIRFTRVWSTGTGSQIIYGVK